MSVFKLILFFSIISLVFVGSSIQVNAGHGGLGSLVIPAITFTLLTSLFVSKGYVNCHIPSTNQIIMFFIIEVVIILFLRCLDISFFDYNKGQVLEEFRGVKVMTGFHSGSVSLYLIYVISFLLLYEKYQKPLLRLLFLVSIVYLIYCLGSRAAILGIVAVIFLLPFRCRPVVTNIVFVTLFATPLMLGVFLDFLSDIGELPRFFDLSGREASWAHALNAFSGNWLYMLFGSGELNLAYDGIEKSIGTHNIFLSLLSRFGVVVYAAIFVFFYKKFSSLSCGVTRLSIIGCLIFLSFHDDVFGFSSVYLAALLILFHADLGKNGKPNLEKNGPDMKCLVGTVGVDIGGKKG